MKLDKLDDWLIAEWRKAYKMYSAWIFVIIAALPDMYNTAIASNLITADQVPPLFARIINLIAAVGLLSRLLKQKKLERDAEVAAAPADPAPTPATPQDGTEQKAT